MWGEGGGERWLRTHYTFDRCKTCTFTAVKRKNQLSRALQFELVLKVHVCKVGMKTMHKMSRQIEFRADKTWACQLLYFEWILDVESLSFQKGC